MDAASSPAPVSTPSPPLPLSQTYGYFTTPSSHYSSSSVPLSAGGSPSFPSFATAHLAMHSSIASPGPSSGSGVTSSSRRNGPPMLRTGSRDLLATPAGGSGDDSDGDKENNSRLSSAAVSPSSALSSPAVSLTLPFDV
jgi:hypothetical protein